MVGASPGAEFERSPETRSIGVEGALRHSRDTIIESILEVERIMGFPATESNIRVYLEEQLEGVLGVHFGKGIYLIGRSITWTSLAAHEVAHYYFVQRNSPYWFYEGVAEYIGEIAQRNVDSPPSDVVGNDVTAHMRKGALEFCEREGIAPATISNAESVQTERSSRCQVYLGEHVIGWVAYHVGETQILESLREIYAQDRKRENKGPLTTGEIFDILLDPQDHSNTDIRNELGAILGLPAQ